MRTSDIIRAVLDLLDQESKEQAPTMTVDVQGDEEETSRFRQIFDLLDKRRSGPLANTPTEVVADVDSVTTLAGGGLNGPKHPADIRVKDPRGYE